MKQNKAKDDNLGDYIAIEYLELVKIVANNIFKRPRKQNVGEAIILRTFHHVVTLHILRSNILYNDICDVTSTLFFLTLFSFVDPLLKLVHYMHVKIKLMHVRSERVLGKQKIKGKRKIRENVSYMNQER